MPIKDMLNLSHFQSLAPKNNQEFVIMLHGLGRTRRSMAKIGKELSRVGYNVINQGYPSTRQDIAALTNGFVAPAVKQCLQRNPSKIHLVSHSMGGLLIRKYLQTNELPQGSRIVMLSPPNQGSEVAEFLKQFAIYRWILGPAAQQLGTSDILCDQWRPIAYELGIITGNRSSDPWFSKLIPAPNDGKVSVERAKLPEMSDFLVIPAGHTLIMRSQTTIRQILYFLQVGHFESAKT